jgi:DNA end-binding protein Ku
LKDLIQRKVKAKGRKIVDTQDDDARPSGSNVVDLMAALKKSLEKPGKAAPAAKAPAKKPAAKKAPAKKPAARKRA